MQRILDTRGSNKRVGRRGESLVIGGLETGSNMPNTAQKYIQKGSRSHKSNSLFSRAAV